MTLQVEYFLCHASQREQRVRLSVRAHEILEAMESTEKDKIEKPWFL